MAELAAELLIEVDHEPSLNDEIGFSWNEYIIEDEYAFSIEEFDKAPFKNLRTQTALLMELITNPEDIEYPPDRIRRQRHEVSGGYKIAKRRGARLNEVKVFNLLFRFTDPGRKDAIAIMLPSKRKGEKERILLLPEDTTLRFEIEKKLYLGAAAELVLRGRMEPDTQSGLIENLRRLNIHERCAQTLQHEFGHVLHWREWQSLGISSNQEIYKWFYDSGYFDIVDRRVPGFAYAHAAEKILMMKESLVEDYRISLNLAAEHDMFILPNKYCFYGDFEKPVLMREGVDIMNRVLKNQIRPASQRSASSSDYDSLRAFAQVSKARKIYPNWVAGERTATKETISSDIKQLRELDEAAISIEIS